MFSFHVQSLEEAVRESKLKPKDESNLYSSGDDDDEPEPAVKPSRGNMTAIY